MTEPSIPPEIAAGFVFELVGACVAEYMDLEEAAPNVEDRDEMRRRWLKVRELKFSFDPHSAAAVDAVLEALTRELERAHRLSARLIDG